MTAATPPGPRDWLEGPDALRDALRIHHPIMRSETGPFSGCRCGQVRLGQDVVAHVVAELRAVLALPALVGALRAVEALAERYEATAARRTKLAEKFERRGRDNTAEDFRALADDSRLHANRLRAALSAVRRDGSAT